MRAARHVTGRLDAGELDLTAREQGELQAEQLVVGKAAPGEHALRNRRRKVHVAQGARHALAPEEYYDMLCRLPGHFSLWQTEYCQPMPSHEAILEWYRGAALRPYLAALAEDARPAFEREVLAGVRKLYPPRADGSIAFPMPRLFFTVQRGAV